MINNTDKHAGVAPWSSHRRLLELSPVFSPVDLSAQLGAGKLSTARVLLTRWHRAGLTMPVSPRGGICLNLVKLRAVASMDYGGMTVDVQYSDHSVWRPWLEQAVARAFPSAIRVGAEVLHEAGWITQLPRNLTVATVREGIGSRSVVSDALTEQLRIVVRPARWYSTVHDGGGVLQFEGRRAPMNTLSPTWALADAIVFGTGAGLRLSLDADDIDIDEMDEAAREEFFAALGALAEVGRVRTPWGSKQVGASHGASEHLAMDDDGIAERMQEAMDRITPRTVSARRKRQQIGQVGALDEAAAPEEDPG